VITAVPAVPPVTVPVAEPTVATEGDPELHTPPPELVRLMEEPVQTVVGPEIADGLGFTVTGATTKQPVERVYVIRVTPGVTPVMVPDADPMVATDVLPLVHVPPGTAFVSVSEFPTQIVIPIVPGTPIIGPGLGLTVTVYTSKHPVESIYVITAVPAATPVTTPVEDPTVATPGEPELQTPPDGLPVKAIVDPTHTLFGPLITGFGFTMILIVPYTPGETV